MSGLMNTQRLQLWITPYIIVNEALTLCKGKRHQHKAKIFKSLGFIFCSCRAPSYNLLLPRALPWTMVFWTFSPCY